MDRCWLTMPCVLYPVQTTGCAKRNLWFEPGTVR
ncbi:MAG: hypothetical protein ACJAUC_004060, partial [Planctomycetota bacterium]